MNITVFGASGGTGGHVVTLAAQRGHHVLAVYRQAPAAPPSGTADMEEQLAASGLDWHQRTPVITTGATQAAAPARKAES